MVRAEAQRAKAAADKPRQKAAGQLIAALKREIAALGACPYGTCLFSFTRMMRTVHSWDCIATCKADMPCVFL